MARRLAGLALLVFVLGTAAEAYAAKAPVYRDPPKYRGVKKTPKYTVVDPPAPPAAPLGTGFGPHVVIDDAGTAHIVWNEGRGDAADVAVYCRLKRGATGCEHRAVLEWHKNYGAGDDPRFNIDDGGPRIARVGDQLVVLSKRYPTTAERPDGTAGSSNTLAWTSSDGGSSWSGAQQVGTLNLGQLAVVGGGDNATIVNAAVDPLCRADGPAGWCLEMFKPGQFGSQMNLSTRSNENYYPGIALDERGVPISVAGHLDGTATVRRWTGAEPMSNPVNWTTASAGVADQPVVAGGPAGAFMMAKPVFNGGPFAIRRLNVGGDGVVSAGPPAPITHDSSIFAALTQDPSGRLHAAWQGPRVSGTPEDGAYIRSASGAGFAPWRKLIDGGANGQIDLAATEDGGGFAVLNHTGGCCDEGELIAFGFGSQAATDKPGLGNLQGGSGPTNVTCQKVGFGRFDIETAAGCLYHGQGASAGLVVSTGELTLNGLRIVPDANAKIVIDPKKLRIDTVGSVKVIVSSPLTGDVVLWHGEIHRDLANLSVGSTLFEFPSQAFKANVLGFDVAANIPVKLRADGVHIPVDLKLPKEFGGFTGHADLLANRSGLQVSSLKIHAGPIALGALLLERVDVDWRAGGNWSGEAALKVPAGGTITARIEFADGEFVKATFNLPFTPPATIGPFVYLIQVNGGFGLKPVQIQAGATIAAGAVVAGEAPVKVNGTFKMTFPSSGPASFQLTGTASIFFFDLAKMVLEFQTDGYAAFRGDIGAALGPVEVKAVADGFVDATTGQFGTSLEGDVKLCFEIVPCIEAGADVGVNNKGFAACGELFGESAGLQFPWDEFDPLVFVNPVLAGIELVDHFEAPCHTTGYKTPEPRPFTARVAAAGGQTFSIKGGLPSATIVVQGADRAPSITVKGPGGVTLRSGDQPSAAGYIVVPRGIPAAYVALTKPQGGDWTVVPNEGSTDITRVLTGDGFTPATVTAKLRKRAIAYRVRNGGNGQAVQFRETGRFGTHVLGTVSKARGTLRFKPAAGPGGKRKVVAVVLEDGFVASERTIGTYTAPGPVKPGAVGRLRAKHAKNTVTVSWRGARGADRYVVRLRGSKGTQLARMLGARGRGAKFTAARRDERFTVTVRGLARSGRAGPVKTVKTR